VAENKRKAFMVGAWKVEPGRCIAGRGTTEVKLEPRSMDLLVHLADHAGEVLSRESIERAVWRDMVVGYDALTNAVNKLRKSLDDDSRQPHLIETVPKRGYRLIAPVAECPAVPGETVTGNAPRRIGIPALALAALVLVVAWAGLSRFQDTVPDMSGTSTNVTSAPDPARIAVLPFDNLDADDRFDHINDGITEDIITDLSKLSGLFVIAHHSSQRYRESDLDLRNIADELGVRYILEGSIRTDQDRIRVNAQLVDSHEGGHLWTDRFDYALDDLFAMQDAVTLRIIEALAIALTEHESELLHRPTTRNLAAYDAFLRGQRFYRHRNREGNESAKEAYEEALRLDPDYARPYGGMAVALVAESYRHWSADPKESLRQAEAYARKAVELSDTPLSLWALAYVLLYQERHEEASEFAERALQAEPSFGDGYGLLALIRNAVGDAESAERLVRRGMELNPFYSWDYAFILGRALYTQGRYEEARFHLEEAIERNPNALFTRLILAATYIRLGRTGDAEWEVMEVLGDEPDWDWAKVTSWVHYRDQTAADAFRTDLRQAGLPD
jgi:TolB-like protein/DNA-binding winged helix-turn-helix (wHTH) protein/cytochrome c-type biogenesis protein CcmH/NrfG